MYTFVLIVLLPFFNAAHAASFDCRKATTAVERTICSNEALSRLDSQLKADFDTALARATDPAALRAAQRNWLTEVRDKCVDQACIERTYKARLVELGAVVPSAAGSAGDGISGTYKAAQGQLRALRLADGKVKFELHAMRDMNTGEVAGEATLRGNTAIYVNRDDDCTLALVFSSNRVTVTQSSTCGMGLNVTGAGTYMLVDAGKPRM